MVAQFDLSKYGRFIVTSEDPISTLRKIFVVITLIIGTIAVLYTARLFWMLRLRQQRFAGIVPLPLLVKVTFLVYILNVIVHTLHYADNIYRPVDYYEPRWLYRRYLFETMEITFFINFPILISGSISIGRLFDFQKSKLIIRRSPCYGMFAFIAGSLMTVMHYRVEPPSSYKLEVNGTIAGEGVLALVLAGIVFRCMAMTRDHGELDKADGVEAEVLIEPEEEQAKGLATRRSPRQKREK